MYSYYAFLLIFVSRVTPMAFNVLIKLRRIFTFMAKIRSIFAILQQAHRTYGYGERAGGAIPRVHCRAAIHEALFLALFRPDQKSAAAFSFCTPGSRASLDSARS